MPAKGSVDLTIQTLFCLAPILDMYAAYRIKKLRMYLLIVIFVVAMPVSIASAVFLPADDEDTMDFMMYEWGEDKEFLFSVGVYIGTVLFSMFLIRRWSKQWNTQFDVSST